MMRKFQEVYIPALKANYMVWPLVQILNFRVVPVQFQIVSLPHAHLSCSTHLRLMIELLLQPLVSTVGIAWTAYLSLSNSSDEPVASNPNSP